MDYVTDLDTLHEQIADNNQLLIYKHSTQCPISASAHEEVEEFINEHEVPYAAVRVIEERPISDAIEQELGVKHESPQALVIKDGEVAWHDSHTDIKQQVLTDAWNSVKNS